jgi:Protein of unknown function (DUF1573)
MKLLVFAIIIALSSAFTFSGGAEFFFEASRHKFPDTNAGVTLTHDFKFTNIGTEPLIINEYKVACTCTKIDFPKEPIPPNQTGTIRLTFDTTGKYGLQNRKIQLFSNSIKNPFELSFKVYVIPAD